MGINNPKTNSWPLSNHPSKSKLTNLFLLLPGTDPLQQLVAQTALQHRSAAKASHPRPGREQVGHDPERDREVAGTAETYTTIQQPHTVAKSYRVRNVPLISFLDRNKLDNIIQGEPVDEDKFDWSTLYVNVKLQNRLVSST